MRDQARTAVVLVAVLLAQGLLAQPTPFWPPRFYIEFNETTPPALGYHANGKWWYDSTQASELLHRNSGAGDRYCSTVFPLQHTPCQHLVTGGKRYLVFPERKYCCMCCTSSDGCGIVSPSWLNDAEFVGTVTINKLAAYKWSKKGLQPNYYYSSADNKQIPLELDQIPTDYQTFHPETFSDSTIDAATFAVPAYCKLSCPWYSICSALHGRSTASLRGAKVQTHMLKAGPLQDQQS